MANWAWFTRVHKQVFRLTGGRVGARLGGLDMVFIDTIGRKSGEIRTVPIACYPYDGDIAVVASNNGQDVDPQWWKNLKAKPDVMVQLGRERYRVHAEEITGDAREAFWPEVIAMNPRQAHYRSSAKRELPLIRLRRVRD